MLGNGVIVESVISFKITWQNPGNGKQPIWDQTDQEITLHSSSVYPDLHYTKAQGIATYYKYTTIDVLLELIKQIDEVIDQKLNTELAKPKESNPVELSQKATDSQLANKPNDVSVPGGELNSPTSRNEVTNDSQNKSEPGDSESPKTYTVTVYGNQLRMLDGQVSSTNIRIRHKVSDNLIRKIPENEIDNSKNIWLEVKNKFKTVKLEIDEFTVDSGMNLLVQVLPTVDITLVPGEKYITPKTEEEVEYRDKLKFMSGIRMSREEERFTRVKQEIDSDRKKQKLQ